ncbi:MAG: hypothetical protein PUG48_02230 [Clostridia bacterium]|nr:hypothetical protein [Clostridia bacterium]
MQKKVTKNSKKGFSLPAAMGITAVLIILSASLIIIAANSISTTSTSINSRQAYLNVKSALEYAQQYYKTNISSINSSGTATTQYMIMRDNAGGTVNDGADISNVDTTADKTTYVIAEYTPASAPDVPKLKLTAYSHYSDSFGKKGLTSHLSVTLNVGSGKGTIMITPPYNKTIGGGGSTSPLSKNITLNVRQAPGQNWAMAYYTWTFKDEAGAYTGTSSSYDIKPTIDQANTNEKDRDGHRNVVHPAGKWVSTGSADKIGPPALATESGNGWLSSTFYPTDGNVNYFNIIFAKKGAVLNNADGTTNDDAQTCEMFHLWYLDPSDRNVYFEFLNKDIFYYKGSGWNGKTNLEEDSSGNPKDTILVYTKNTKTTVHFKVKGVDNSAVVPSISAPVINSVTVGGTPLSGDSYLGRGSRAVSNLRMTYEGCGWWTANVETNDNFKMEVTYSALGVNNTGIVTVTPNSDSEAWVYADAASGTIQSRLSESNANIALGVSSDSYVTIHAKSYDTKNKVVPKLNYKDVQLNSSSGRINLYNKILEAQQYKETNYTEESYAILKRVLNGEVDSAGNVIVQGAIDLYNDTTFISSQTGPTSAEKVAQADVKYNDKVEEIDNAINALIAKVCDDDTLDLLKDLIKQGDDIVTEQTNNGKYDSSYYGVFIASGGAYQTAKAMDLSTVTISEAETQIVDLQKAIDDINAHVLDRSRLEALITEATTLSTDTKYEQPYREALKTNIAGATSVLNTKSTTQSVIDTAANGLQRDINIVKSHPVTVLDTSNLATAISAADALLNRTEKLNCTDETYNALQAECNNANTVMTSATTQADVDNETAKLESAIKLFTVAKPSDSNDELLKDQKIKVWFKGLDTYTFTVYQSGDGSHSGISSEEIKNDVASGLSYTYINRELFHKIDITISKDGKDYTSNEISLDVADNNLVVDFEGTFDETNSTCTITEKKLTIIYIEAPDDTSYSPLVKVNGAEVQNAADVTYFAAKFVSDENNQVVINSKSDGSGTDTTAFKVSAGQFIVRYKTDTEVELINAKSIYPIYETTTGSSTGYRISGATIDTENLISPVILSNATSNYSIALTSSTKIVKEAIDVTPPSGKMVMVVDTKGVSKLNGKTPIAHIWGDKGDYDKFPGNALLRYEDTDYYYTIVDDDVKGLIISSSYDASGKSKVGGNIMLTSKKAGDRYVMLYHNDPGNNFNKTAYYPNSTYAVPQIERSVYTVDVGDMTASNITMAFVGGNKVRITNKSYYETYGSGVKNNQNGSTKISSSNLFGGKGGNANSMNRVGDSKLSAYYDWYEFKIPVDKLSNYTFEVCGLGSGSDTTYIQQISQAYGDVWITLNSKNKSGSVYDDVSVYTFDPEKNQMEYVYDASTDKTIEKTRIYFNMPSGWKNAEVSVSGSGVPTTLSFTNRMSSYSSNPSAVNYYYVDVDVNTPFVTFTAVKDDNTAYQCRTSLQGGDTVLFNPMLNSGYGGWEDYVSPQTCLKREVLKAQTMYYGSVIIGKYDDNGYVADNGSHTYNYAEHLYDEYKAYTRYNLPESEKPDSTISMKKIYSLGDSSADSNYVALHQWLTAYDNLYSAMSSAKKYIKDPITSSIHPGGGVYPEYKNRNSTQQYEEAGVNTLKSKLKNAEDKYLASSVSIDDLNTATKKLKVAISNVTVSSEGSITAIFYDAQRDAKRGAKIEIKYTTSGGITKTETVRDVNVEDFPLIRIFDTSITDVEFLVNGTSRGIVKDKMEKDSTWVFLDYSGSKYWKENTTYTYITTTTDTFEQTDATDAYIVNMKHEIDLTTGAEKPEYRSLVLYFNYDTNVKLASGESFQVKAGAYIFTNEDAGDSNSPFYGGTFNLYSDKSKAYFTNPVNYGELIGAKDAATLGWVDSNGVLSGTAKSTVSSINITARNSKIDTFRRYTSLQSMYFRYEDNDNPFVIKREFTLAAKDFVIASSATFDGSSSLGAHFYLKNTDTSSDSLRVEFKSDIHVKYRDRTGEEHSFAIRSGNYEIKKKDSTQTYIADFFDEDYWRSEFVMPLDDESRTYGSGEITLTDPVYSD